MKLIRQAFANCLQNLVRNKLINVLSLAIIVFTLLIFSIFNFLTYSIERFSAQFSDDIRVIFYFKSDIPRENIDRLYRQIESHILVKSLHFKSRDQALSDFAREFPELNFILSEFDASPFPSSLEVIFNSPGDSRVTTDQIMNFIQDIEQNNIIDSRQINLEWVRRLTSLKKFISSVGFFLSVILIFISLFIIYNVIKINILYRRDEIDILKLVGATDFYIRFPFIIEGAFLGFLGSLFSIGLLMLLLWIFPHLSPVVSNIIDNIVIAATPPFYIIRNVILLGTGIGIFSSFLSIRQFMKE